MGKIIYESKGKAAEYAKYAFSAYLGCTCGCTYCYNKTGRFKGTFGGDTPTLKKCFRDEEHALEIFEKELKQNLSELQKHGLFFSFTTDPFLPETIDLTIKAVKICVYHSVNVKLLTKRVDFAEKFFKPLCSESSLRERLLHIAYTSHVAFGFTLTGKDELEPGASINSERIEAMKILHDSGYKTFASIEPTIILSSSRGMISLTIEFCDMYKIGLLSGKKFDKDKLRMFVEDVCEMTAKHDNKVYFKDGLLQQAGIKRENLPSNCVGRDYNIFK